MSPVICDHAKRVTHRNSVLKELRELQTLAKSDCDNPDTTPAARAQLMRAYVCLEQQRNVLRMRPAPKPIDVSQRPKRQQRGGLSRSAPAPTNVISVQTPVNIEPNAPTSTPSA